MNRAPANKENVVPIPARYPCQKDIGVRPGKRKAEANLGTQWMKENAALKRQNHGTKLVADGAAQQQTGLQSGVLGATSFAGIGDIIRQEQPFTSNNRPEAQTSSVRTFADITTKTANASAQEPHIDSSSRIEQLFSSSFSLHAEDASDHFNRASLAALQQQQKAAQSHTAALPSSCDPPLDWSIKTAIRFSSSEPFAIAEEALTVSADTACSAVRAFAACEEDDMRNLQERYQAASMSWQHPEASYHPAALTALRAAKCSPDPLAQRHAAWQEAFRGLYHALRHRKCDAFYLATPQGVHQQKQNMVFFGAPGIAGRTCLHAIVSRSTLGVRTAMQQHYQLSFSMPLAPALKKKQQEDDLQLPDDLAVLQTRGGVTGREQDGTRESLLYFEGPLEVQGLFEYLFNERRRLCGEECDVPLLMAPVPFPAACLKHLPLKGAGHVRLKPFPHTDGSKLQVTFEPELRHTLEWHVHSDLAACKWKLLLTVSVSQPLMKVLAASEHARGKTVQHKLEMKGCIPPWVVDRVTRVIKDAHPAKFQMVAETAPMSGSFNVQSGSCDCASAVRAPLSVYHTGGAVNSHEAERWRAPPGQLANLVVRDIVCCDSQFMTRLTRCSGANS